MAADPAQALEKLRKLFEAADVDKDGLINAADLCAAGKKLAKNPLTEEQCEKVISGVDTDGDKKVTLQQLVDAIKEVKAGKRTGPIADFLKKVLGW